MRKAIKPPSEWLKLLCKQWADENPQLVDSTDAKFMDYKPYLKGMLTSQLLVRLSIPPITKDFSLDGSPSPTAVDFWRILGIEVRSTKMDWNIDMDMWHDQGNSLYPLLLLR